MSPSDAIRALGSVEEFRALIRRFNRRQFELGEQVRFYKAEERLRRKAREA